MKIVQINGSYTLANSTGRSTVEMHSYFLENGIQSWVYAAYVDPAVEEQQNVYSLGYGVEQKFHAALSRVTGLQGYYSNFSTKHLISNLKHISPDVVVLGVLHNNSIHFPMLARYLAESKIAVVLVLHDCWYYTGHCCYYSQARCDKWKDKCGDCDQIKEWNTSMFFDTSKQCLKDKRQWFSKIAKLGVVGVSDWVTNEARLSILRDACKIQRIYNWIDMEVFHPMDQKKACRELGFDEDRKLLLGVASEWSARKGLDELIEIARRWEEAQVVLIGETPRQFPQLENLTCVGTVREPKLLAKYYAAADVFVNPSIQETFGKTTAEALCCGTPVVSYRTTACTELIKNKRGKIVELGDTEGFLIGVRQVAESGKDIWRPSCLAFAHQNFEKVTNIQQYLELFQSLKIEGGRKG